MNFVERFCFPILLAFILLSSVTVPARAVDFSEAVNGDLSDDTEAPTSLGTLSIGANTLTATLVDGDYDLATFTVPDGAQLQSIVLSGYDGSSVSFSGLQSGSVWTTGVEFDIDATLLLGWTHFGVDMIGTDILDDFSQGSDAIGFTPPLPAGAYTIEIQETGPFAVTASLTFNVVPEPASMLLAGLGVLGLSMVARRRLQ